MNYRRHLTLDSIAAERDALLDSREYKSEKRMFEASLAEERRLTEEFWNRFDQDMEKPGTNLKWWRKQLEKLDVKSAKNNRLYQNMHETLKYKIFAHALETARFRTLPMPMNKNSSAMTSVS